MSLLFCEVFAPDWWLDISQLEKRAELDWGERKMGGRSLDTLGSNSPLSWEGFSMSNLDHSCRWRRWGGAPGWPTDPPAPGSLSMSLQTPSGLRWVDPSAILLTIIKKKYGSLINSAVCYDCCKRWKLRRSLDCGCSSLTFNCQKHQKIVRNKYISLAIYWS